jgi:DNA-binding GntR family transcriptional regulator
VLASGLETIAPHPSLPDVVRLALKRRIVNNEIPAGARLVEASLAAELGVSRTTLRAALRELRNDGLVEIIPRRGCFVARMSPGEIDDVCFARYVLEAGAACETWARFDGALLAALEGELGAMAAAASAGDAAAVVESDTRFHSLITQSGGRRKVAELWHALDGKMGSLMRSSLEHQGIALGDTVSLHQSLLGALRTGDKRTIERAIKAHYLEPRISDITRETAP